MPVSLSGLLTVMFPETHRQASQHADADAGVGLQQLHEELA